VDLQTAARTFLAQWENRFFAAQLIAPQILAEFLREKK
jgi:hypothetical protein